MWHGAFAGGLIGAAILAMAAGKSLAQSAPAPQSCPRAEFEAVVDDAAEALRNLTQKNSPAFQAKLRQLKDKRGWSHEQFLAGGARFVRDDKIAEFDDKSDGLLARINGAGNEAGGTSASDCRRLADLRANMGALVEIQNAKWAYMFGNIDAELAK